jgi:RNA recognition motif-containing protein
MGRKLYVGNLPFSVSDDSLTELFSQAGKVESARVVRDQAMGQSRGFAFVEMASDEEAQRAISQLNQHAMEGRSIVVNEARPKTEGARGGYGGGGGYDRGRGGHGRRGRSY